MNDMHDIFVGLVPVFVVVAKCGVRVICEIMGVRHIHTFPQCVEVV
jgi:hypothetical protein